jgi:mannuronan synthase
VSSWSSSAGRRPAVQLGRALYYRGVVFPRWRRAADRLGEAGAASQVYILIATYRIHAETTARVYQAAIAEAIRYGRPVTIVAAIVEVGDQRLIKRVFQQIGPPAAVRLAFTRRPPIGKRHQIACSLRAISRLRPPNDAAVVFMDGDTLLTPGSLARSLPFLRLMPDVDAITTDEECIVAAGT